MGQAKYAAFIELLPRVRVEGSKKRRLTILSASGERGRGRLAAVASLKKKAQSRKVRIWAEDKFSVPKSDLMPSTLVAGWEWSTVLGL